MKDIKNLVKEKRCSGYDAILFHVGTNDLVKDDVEIVVNNLENLIQDIKPHTNKIAISGVIKRSDGGVSEGVISSFNKRAKELCAKSNVNYIANDNIHWPHLNGSKLHLNRVGD